MLRGLAAVAACLGLLVAGCGDGSSSGSVVSSAGKAEEARGPAPTRRKPTIAVPGAPPPRVLVRKDLIVGSGARAEKGDEVTIQYLGTLYASGDTFDSTSWRASAPLVFTLGDPGLTKGWNRGMPGMRVGGRRELIIPPRLAYGPRQVGPVPPNSTLVYVIDLIAVESPPG